MCNVTQYSCAVYSLGGNTIFICLPLSGGHTLHLTLYCSPPHYCQCHHHRHFCCQCHHHFTWHPNVIFVSFHVLIYEISQILEPWISDEANASWAQPHLARALMFFLLLIDLEFLWWILNIWKGKSTLAGIREHCRSGGEFEGLKHKTGKATTATIYTFLCLSYLSKIHRGNTEVQRGTSSQASKLC